MSLGRRKLLALLLAATLLVATSLAAFADDLRLLLVVTNLTLLSLFAVLAWLITSGTRRVDQRLKRLDRSVERSLRSGLTEPAIIEQFRSLALPQEHADMLLRALHADNARLEASHRQLEEHINEALEELRQRR
jgi:cell division protein FtsB